ncbi:RluA family pseudouridine synthase [Lacticaseibacillus mingshuiensis]|uniref:Pseudouridine synthase n=1 Tax=Lacticaseibacillus mingshuiensis TaxID=2799574 RepID=A0ABW4CG95_9LACO|nr:RluA family pseudouridine synthase [Lacticaseibacillus mingshuiensis]
MRFQWRYHGESLALGRFLQHEGFSRIQLKRLKYQGGFVFVNKKQRNLAFLVQDGDRILLQTAPEIVKDVVVPTPFPLDIVYEDAYLLVVNKPAGVASIPDPLRGNDSMANYVKAHLLAEHAESAAVHVVTRLDRDTSGLMLFAKHGFVHSLLDRQLHSTRLQKTYLAVATNKTPMPPHGWLMLPIGHDPDFYMRRKVVANGKRSITEYQVLAQNSAGLVAQVALHTGRTHQIRVHFAGVGHPLYGDDLYGGPMRGITRQALHCWKLALWHPFLQRTLELTAAVPSDMVSLCDMLELPIDRA